MDNPMIKVEPDKCPYCGEALGIVFPYSGPDEHKGEFYRYNYGKISCEKCKRTWTIKLLVQLKENKEKGDKQNG